MGVGGQAVPSPGGRAVGGWWHVALGPPCRAPAGGPGPVRPQMSYILISLRQRLPSAAQTQLAGLMKAAKGYDAR